MIISDFTSVEIEHFRKACNFVNYEVNVFEGRVEGKNLQEIADEIGISYDYVRKISQKVNRKIHRLSF
jgi:DNA-directed RNA polymerase specialized sigma subunit